MFDPFDENHTSYWIPYADFLAGVLVIFAVVAIMMLFQVTDPKQKMKDGDIKSPGTVMVETFWKENTDVDVWVKSPNDLPVGYSRKTGRYFDLLRDDLGNKYEASANIHHENVFSRNAPEGEYVVNLHMYSNRDNSPFPIEVTVDVRIVKSSDNDKIPIIKVLRTKVPLIKLGEEVTVVRFRLDAEANLVPDSINHSSMPLREKK
jgi:hypothetical protein